MNDEYTGIPRKFTYRIIEDRWYLYSLEVETQESQYMLVQFQTLILYPDLSGIQIIFTAHKTAYGSYFSNWHRIPKWDVESGDRSPVQPPTWWQRNNVKVIVWAFIIIIILGAISNSKSWV